MSTSRNLGPGINLANPFVGISSFGEKTVPIYGTDEQLYNVIGEEKQKLNVVDYLLANNSTIADAIGHKSTFVKVYKNVNGKLEEVDAASVTPQDVASGKIAFEIGGKTGGPNRERVAQLYAPQGDKLVPVGEGTFYKGEHPDQTAFDLAKVAAAIVGAYYLGPTIIESLGGAAAGAEAAGAAAAGEGVLAGTSAASGVPAALSGAEAAGVLGGATSGVPAALTGPELAAAGAGATSPATLTVVGKSVPAVTSISPAAVGAGALGGAALTSALTGGSSTTNTSTDKADAGADAGADTGAKADADASAGAGAGATSPESVTVAGKSLTDAISPTTAAAGILGGAALTSALTGEGIIANEAANVAKQQKVTTQDPADVATSGITTTAAAAGAGASILKQLADATGLSEDTLKNLLLGGAGLLGAKASYDDAKAAREAAKGTPFKSSSGYKTVTGPGGVTGFKKAAQGGVMSLDMAQGRYLGGITDGMADKVPASIDNRRPAALSDGEFVVPADVVSHLGNGNSNAGAKRLYEMMDRIRGARTGNTKQGKQINPNKFLPR